MKDKDQSDTPVADSAQDDVNSEGSDHSRDKQEESSSAALAQSADQAKGSSDSQPADEAEPDRGEGDDAADTAVAEARESEVNEPPSNQRAKRFKLPVKSLMALGIGALIVASGWWAIGLIEQRQQVRLDRHLATLDSRIDEVRDQLDTFSQTHGTLKTQQSGIQKSLSESIAKVDQKVKAEQQSIAQNSRAIEQQNQQVSMLEQRLDGQQKRLLSLSTTSREDWLLAEAEYLLRLANQRVMLERSPANAIALMQAADKIVAEVAGGLGDADLFAVRQAIARELSELKLVEDVDREGLFLQLQALAEQAGSLPRVPAHRLTDGLPESELPSATDDDSEDSPGWWERTKKEITAIAGVLDQYIKIEDIEAPPNPLIDQHLAQIVALNLRVAIEQAQLALLRDDAAIYETALQKAEQLVREHYVESDVSRQYLALISGLRDHNVAPELPDISSSLKLLNGYIVRLHRLDPQPEGQL